MYPFQMMKPSQKHDIFNISNPFAAISGDSNQIFHWGRGEGEGGGGGRGRVVGDMSPDPGDDIITVTRSSSSARYLYDNPEFLHAQ